MAKNETVGVCNICGQYKKLSFEHVPPQAAGNTEKVLTASVEQYWNRGPGKNLRATGKQMQRGYGKQSICVECNSKTGKWYVEAFARWCLQGLQFRENSGGQTALYHFTTLSPLLVIKQIATMFLALHGDELSEPYLEALRRFVLNRSESGLPPNFRFWVYYLAPGPLRNTPVCVTLNVTTGKSTCGSEFSFPPFGYMVTLDSAPEDPRLVEITYFSRFREMDIAHVPLLLEQLPTHGSELGDYRSFKDMSRVSSGPNVVVSGPWSESTFGRRG